MEMTEKQRKQRNGAIIFLMSMVYFVSYLTRKTYPSVMKVMINEENLSPILASLPLTLNSITYAFGQIVSGFLSDRFKPTRIISIGLTIAVLMNVFVPFTVRIPVLTVILWSLNGLAQALLWPPMVKIALGTFDLETYRKACVRISWGGNFGTMILYLLSSWLVTFSWRYTFWMAAICGLLMLAAWLIFSPRIGYRRTAESKKENKEGSAKFRVPVLILALIMLGIVFQGFLRDGLEAWMPTFLEVNCNLPSSSAILGTVILPVFSIVTIWVVSRVSSKWIRSETACSMTFFLLSGLGALGMALSKNPVLSALSVALASGTVHGVNYCFTCLVPAHFAKSKHAALISGVLNCSTYGGAALAGVGTAFLSEELGMNWTQISLIFLGVAAAGAVLCLLITAPWEAFKKRNQEEK